MLDRLVTPAVSETLFAFMQNRTGGEVPYSALLEYPEGQHGFDAFPFSPGGTLAVNAVVDWVHRILQKPAL
jgi:hypothetical protein